MKSDNIDGIIKQDVGFKYDVAVAIANCSYAISLGDAMMLRHSNQALRSLLVTYIERPEKTKKNPFNFKKKEKAIDRLQHQTIEELIPDKKQRYEMYDFELSEVHTRHVLGIMMVKEKHRFELLMKFCDVNNLLLEEEQTLDVGGP